MLRIRGVTWKSFDIFFYLQKLSRYYTLCFYKISVIITLVGETNVSIVLSKLKKNQLTYNLILLYPLIYWSTTPRTGGEEAHLKPKLLYEKGPQQGPKVPQSLLLRERKVSKADPTFYIYY